MKTMRQIAGLIFVLNSFGCSYNRTLLRDNNKYVRNQYEYLTKESIVFLSQAQQNDFEKNLMNYLTEYKKYNFFNGRENPSMLTPLIVNNYKSVIALIALREKDNAGNDVEYVKFISAKYENNTWIYGVKDGHQYSFSYADKFYPRLSNEKLIKQAISNLMLEGFFKNNFSDKTIFKSSWYVF